MDHWCEEREGALAGQGAVAGGSKLEKEQGATLVGRPLFRPCETAHTHAYMHVSDNKQQHSHSHHHLSTALCLRLTAAAQRAAAHTTDTLAVTHTHTHSRHFEILLLCTFTLLTLLDCFYGCAIFYSSIVTDCVSIACDSLAVLCVLRVCSRCFCTVSALSMTPTADIH